MNYFSTPQLKIALIELHKRTDAEAVAAFQMTYDELHSRMGDDEFDAWCVSQGW